ncbi:hypothetical protein pEaSNUABM5_00331 [Erwinia phage pEa_SNUABM_5]|uniref:Uncharacterized protein n=1 Tax=Erwinia phage pEa_SNUABM_5 TaxID=2797313 RepID=A0A7T8EPU6_9CAUD|nr:hypothetical protein MPK73_gp331 [Erwinia phage pEa_SNUABM_5]QQO90473.1 hypothetical protein pEaSNUABM5_00331 [Erwinia phage pEa_SNUABM_5]
MAKAKSIQTTNTNLLYARVVRADGTKTFINKINANGYGTDAKGGQIHKTRIVQAGKTLRELPEAMAKGEFVLVGGIAHKLNKKQQRGLASGDDAFLDDINVDLDRLQFVEPETATTGRRATLHTPETIAKRVSKRALKSATEKAEKQPSAKRSRKAAKAEGIEVDMLDKKSQTATRKRDRKAASDTSVIKQMPRELKRLISDGQIKLNSKQAEQVLTSLGLDAEFYAMSIEKHFGGLSLVLPQREAPVEKKGKRASTKEPTYVAAKQVKQLVKNLKTRLVPPTAKFAAQHKKKLKEVREFWSKALGMSSHKDVKPGLTVIDDYGNKLVLVAIDAVSTVFAPAKKDGDERLFAHALLNQNGSPRHFKLAPADELDASV